MTDEKPAQTYENLGTEKWFNEKPWGNPLTFSKPAESAVIHILPPNGEQGALLSIHSDGRITFGPAFTTTDEASLLFWRTLADSLPAFKQMLLSEQKKTYKAANGEDLPDGAPGTSIVNDGRPT